MAGAFDKCIKQMKAAAGKNADGKEIIDDKIATKILKTLSEERKKQTNAGGTKDPDLAFLDKVNNMIASERTAAIIEKRNAQINLIKKKEVFDYAANFKDDHEALQAFLAGIGKDVVGGRSSVAARQQALFERYMKGMLVDLERDGLLPHFKDVNNGKDIAIELFELENPEGHPGRTDNPFAVKVAKVVRKYQDELVLRQNEAGAWIQKLPGYIAAQSHDMEKVRKVSYQEWRDFILQRLDTDRTFEFVSKDKWDETLQEAYKGIATGKHLKPEGAKEADGLNSFRGPGSLGRSVSEHRIFHYKSPESWVEYNEKFGVGTVQGSIMKGIDRATKNLGLMEKMGPNPENFLNTIVDQMKDRNKSNLPVFDKLDRKSGGVFDPSITHLMDELTGKTSAIDDLGIARIAQNIRKFNNLVSLGGSIFSQLPDLAAKAAELRYQGRHPASAYAEAIGDIFNGKGNKEQQIIAHSLGAGFDSILHESMGRFFVEDQLPGVMTNMTNLFFKMNFMEYWNESQKMGLARSMSAFLAAQSDRAYGDLHPRTSEVMKLYQIGEKEWDVIKKAKTKVGDWEYIVPELIDDLEIQTRYMEYITDRVDYGVLTPGVRERAIVNRGTQSGTYEGELFRMLGQFKLFSISVISKLMPRMLQGMQGQPDMVGLVQLIVGGTILGYMGMSMKDIFKGKQPRSLEDPKTWAAAFVQGGGAGIYGDFLFGEYNRFGKDVLDTAAGPTFAKVKDLFNLATSAKKGELKGSEVFQFAKNNTPFLNLFYLRSALDYFILYDLQEQMDPGFIRRMEQRTMEEQNQEFWLPPSSNTLGNR